MASKARFAALAILLVVGIGPTVGCLTGGYTNPFNERPAEVIETRWLVQLNEPEMLAYFPKEFAVPAYANSGKIVMAGSQRGVVVASDSNSGEELWRFKTRGKIRGGIKVKGRAAYFGAMDGLMYRLDAATGLLDWEKPYETRGAITATPDVSSDLLVFQNNENRTYALDPKTGAYKWDQGRPRPDFLTVKGEGGATIAGDTVYAGYDDGFLVAMRASDGASRWSKSLGGNEQRFVDVDTRPVVQDGVVFAASFAVGLYAVEAEHGTIRWLHRGRGIQSPVMGERFLFATDGQRQVLALDPSTGHVRWKVEVARGELSAPSHSNERVWVPTGHGLLMIDAISGHVRAQISPDDGQTAMVATFGSWIHFVTNSGALVGARVYDSE
jgi:outer membrane protein assembly factor BamB